MTEKSREPTAALNTGQVTAYLSQHPGFFVGHGELIPELRIPHQPGDATSLVERQIRLSRERNIEMCHRLSQLMDVAHENDRLFGRARRLVLGLFDATNLGDTVSTVEGNLRHEFQMPYVSLILFSDSSVPVGRSVGSAETHRAIDGLLSDGKTACDVLRPHGLAFLFSEGDCNGVSSAAVIFLSFQGLHSVLAIGSPDPQHYKSSLGALSLGYVAEVLARVLPHFFSSLHSVR